MKKIARVAALAASFAAFAAMAAAEAAPDFQAMLKAVDASVSIMDSDFSAEYAIVQTKPGEGSSSTTAAVLRRDREKKLLVVIMAPSADKGKGYLKVGNILWFYDPKQGSFVEKQATEAVWNSNLTISDMTESTLAADYEVVGSARAKLGSFDCWALDLKAKGSGADYAKKRIWISDDGLMRKCEDSSPTQLMRTINIPSYQKVGSRMVPASIIILNNLKYKVIGGKTVYERTDVTVSKAGFAPIKDAYFSQDYLKKAK